jgi:phosphonate transport system permease protein
VRMSTVIGGGGGIGFLRQQWIRLLMCEEAGAAVWAIALVVAIMDYASAKVREQIV